LGAIVASSLTGTVWLTPSEAAERLCLSVSTLYNRRYYGGDLPPSYDIGGGRFRFDAAEVDQWVRDRREVERP
jgi:predicted DNA-binding transcriptional regulator AlpA